MVFILTYLYIPMYVGIEEACQKITEEVYQK